MSRQYGHTFFKTVKSLVASCPPAGGAIRLVIVREENGCHFFFCCDPEVPLRNILGLAADPWAVEQTFQGLKQLSGAGHQQLQDLWANMEAWHLHLSLDTLLGL